MVVRPPNTSLIIHIVLDFFNDFYFNCHVIDLVKWYWGKYFVDF